jgi:hypothetical protein
MPKNDEVDAWFARYENPMKPLVQRIREIILGADPRMAECIKWQAPTFVYQGNLASFFPKSKQHASLMFHTGAQIPGKHPLLTGGGDTSRVLKLATLAEVNAAKRDIERVVKAWCDFRDAALKGSSATQARVERATKPKSKSNPAKPAAKRARRSEA